MLLENKEPSSKEEGEDFLSQRRGMRRKNRRYLPSALGSKERGGGEGEGRGEREGEEGRGKREGEEGEGGGDLFPCLFWQVQRDLATSPI